MPDYNSEFFDPPAPIAFVTLRNFENSVEIAGVPMLLDTGADASLIPRLFAERLDLDIFNAAMFELEAFDRTISQSAVVHLNLIFEGRNFRGQFLTTDREYGIIGRNILNQLNMLFNGTTLTWEVV